ncbi:MAG: glycoside hydrolase family 27 protein [Rikenellaceae bacterium]|nr:glycoside hydrolase family 27 protein [Rikenellaceae bacterium]
MKKLFIFCVCICLCTASAYADFKDWALTPPMGWNSWDCYGPTVTEDEVKANADYMADYLKDYGWEYIVVDIRWFVENDKAGGYNQTDPIYVMDEYGRYMPAVNRFPSAADGAGFKPLADYIHSKGLKFGIHIMRGIPVEAVKNKLPVKGANGITVDQIYSTDLQCQWLKDNYTILRDKPGAQEYYNSIFDLYASWGVDFIKIDDLSRPYHKDEIEMIRQAIDNTGREIVLSTSPGPTPVAEAEHISNNANMWRMIDDVWDIWRDMDELFGHCENWYPYIKPGTWPDCDMIPLGRISIRGERGADRMTRLTKDEQYSLMTLFTIFRSPLMFGGDLPSNDEFTLSLLTNEKVLEMHRNSVNNRQIYNNNSKIVWTAENPKTGASYLALFNNTDTDGNIIAVDMQTIGINGKYKVTDMWSGEELGVYSGKFSRALNKHGSGLYIIEKQ